jgi:arsenate reductase
MRLSWRFHDPSVATGTDEEKLAVFRHVRDAIRSRVVLLAKRLA